MAIYGKLFAGYPTSKNDEYEILTDMENVLYEEENIYDTSIDPNYNTRSNRIVSGYNALQRPWMALLIFPSDLKDIICGGSIINNQ